MPADLGLFVQQRFHTEFYEGRDSAGMEKLLQVERYRLVRRRR